MRPRHWLLTFSAATGLLLLLCGIGSRRPSSLLPVLSLTGVEPAGMVNRDGTDLWMISCCLSNPDTRVRAPENVLFIKSPSKVVQCLSANHWTDEPEAIPVPLQCSLAPGETWGGFFFVPAGTDQCRIRLVSTGGILGPKARLAWLAQKLQIQTGLSLPPLFWRWAGFITYQPSSRWRQQALELTIPRPPSVSDR